MDVKETWNTNKRLGILWGILRWRIFELQDNEWTWEKIAQELSADDGWMDECFSISLFSISDIRGKCEMNFSMFWWMFDIFIKKKEGKSSSKENFTKNTFL